MPEPDSPSPDHQRQPSSDEQFAIEPPRMTILSDHPILREDDPSKKREPDSFGLQSRLAAAYDILRHQNTQTPIAIAIYGDWGTGKSSAMRWLCNQLAVWGEQEVDRKGHMKLRTVWFDPWKYQKREEVWRGLIAEVILNSIDINKASLATVTNAAKKFGLFLGRSFLNVLSSAKLKAGAEQIGGEAEIDLDVLKKIAEDYHQTAHPEKAYLNEFETTLKEWIKESLKDDERMVVFIDDLDRCLPEVTFEVLEALKLYLNIPKLIFVVGLDRHVVDAYVEEHYAKNGLSKEKAKHYLDKMFQVEIEVPPSQVQIEGYLRKQIEALDKVSNEYWSGKLKEAWGGKHRNVVEDKIRSIAEHNPREIKRLLNSTLLRATAAARNKRLRGNEAERFTQGAQIFLIQHILRRDVPHSAGLMIEQSALRFFAQWSEFVKRHPKLLARDKAQSPQDEASSRIPLTEYLMQSETMKEGPVAWNDEAKEEHKQLQARQPRYKDKDEAYPLLQNEDLWDLMRIPFSADVAAATATDRDASEQPPSTAAEQSAKREKHLEAAPDLQEKAAEDASRALDDLPRSVLSAIAKSLEKPVDRVVADDLLAVRNLNLSGSDINDVSPLEKLQNLEFLHLSGTQVKDVSKLTKLQNLQGLSLEETQVKDVSKLAKLQNLRALFLGRTQVNNVSPLTTLQDLELLSLRGTQVNDEQVAQLKTSLPDLIVLKP